MLDYALKIAQSRTIALIPAASSGFRARLRRVVVRTGLGVFGGSRVWAVDREGPRRPVCTVMQTPRLHHLRLLGLLSLLAAAACTQPSFLFSFAEKTPAAPAERLTPGTAPPDKWSPAPDPIDDEDLPNTERISKMPRKVGECFETTI